MASSVFLQDPQGVVGPLTFTVELHTPGQAVVLHLDGRQVEGEVHSVRNGEEKEMKRSKVPYYTHFQVFFPVQSRIHVLSILESSGVPSREGNVKWPN